MIYVVMGMHKSGTTLVARTLNESGVDMGATCEGEYFKCKYEDFEASAICVSALGVARIISTELPREPKDVRPLIREYIRRHDKPGDWGFKHPAVTLCYPQWRDELPDHVAIGVKRDPAKLVERYARHGFEDRDRVLEVQTVYNTLIDAYGIPAVEYEDLMENGMGALEAIVGRDLVDARVFDRRVRDGG